LINLKVAADAESELFIATPCSVQTVKSVWYDKLHPEQNIVPGQVSLFIGFVSFGLVAPLFVEYRKPKFKKSEVIFIKSKPFISCEALSLAELLSLRTDLT
jgi:hypothetical protein